MAKKTYLPWGAAMPGRLWAFGKRENGAK
jgi:hypothetical protein